MSHKQLRRLLPRRQRGRPASLRRLCNDPYILFRSLPRPGFLTSGTRPLCAPIGRHESTSGRPFLVCRVAPAIALPQRWRMRMAERTAAIERRPGKSKGSKSFQIRASQSGRLGLVSSHASSMVNPIGRAAPDRLFGLWRGPCYSSDREPDRSDPMHRPGSSCLCLLGSRDGFRSAEASAPNRATSTPITTGS